MLAIRPFLVTMMFAFLLVNTATAAEFHIDRSRENRVEFISETPLEDFRVKTSKIDGYVYWESDSFPPKEQQLKSSKIYFEVQLNSLDAGNSMYNRHMKENYLETDKYPYAAYDGRIVEIVLNPDSSFTVRASGVFSIHGKKKNLDIIGVARPSDNGLNIQSSFAVILSDYDIKLPKLMFVKVDEIIKVTLAFYIKSAF